MAFYLPFRNISGLACRLQPMRGGKRFSRLPAPITGRGQAKGLGMAKTVLIVEDNELNMKLFHDLLEAHGYATVGTRNGIEALDLARKHRPDLILMDIQLPEVSGLEVTKWLKDDQELRAHSGRRRHRLRHEGRRGAHPRGRLRGLSLQADLGGQVHRDHPPFPRQSVGPATGLRQ
jgi:hypothetical protein